jgi:uncharacterized protein
MEFPVSGVQCPAWLPPAAAFLVALVCTPAGVSGAFLLLPFQLSVLGFAGVAVTPTNLLFNTIATPGGIYRYLREGRMDWGLGWAIAAGSIPGMFAGAIIRVLWLHDPAVLKGFVGLVLLFLGIRLLWQSSRRRAHDQPEPAHTRSRCALLAFPVGIVGGIYGVGGGAIIAPVAVTFVHLSARRVAGPALFGTLVTSLAGVAAFEFLHISHLTTSPVRPDWTLGVLFGAGGLLGAYCGARIQKYLSERGLRLALGTLTTAAGLSYCGQSAVRLAGGL